MAKDMNWLWIVLLVGGAAIFFNVGGIQQILGIGTGSATPAPSGGGITPPANNGACPATLVTGLSADVMNSLDLSAASYQAMPLRFIADGNFADFIAYTATASSSTTTATTTTKCDHNYAIVTLPAVDTYNPMPNIDLGRVTGAQVRKVIQGTNFSLLQVNAYDNIARGLVWQTEEMVSAGEYDTVAAHLDSTTNNTAIAIGIGGTLDWDIGVKTVTNLEQFGNSNMGVYIGVDADKSDYDAPLLQLNGVTLVDVKNSGEISADDLAALSSYEYIFKVPAGTQFQTAPQTLRFYIAGKAGVDPDADIVLRFLAKNNYVGMDGMTIYTDIFNRASASETISATASTVTIDVS
jgi:hypothetical protein